MTPQEFIEKYLPDYEARMKEVLAKMKYFELKQFLQERFFEENFQEALIAYSQQLIDKVCEKQRESHIKILFSPEKTQDPIKDAIYKIGMGKQPKLEELL